MITEPDMARLEERIGYHFQTPELLHRATTRLAFAQEHQYPDGCHMDALATLGDAVIDLLVIEALVLSGRHEKGDISVTKSNMVNMSVLRNKAEELTLHEYIRWGRGEEKQHVWTSGRVLAECVEALAGAVYLDGGIKAAREVLAGLEVTGV